MPLLNSTKGFCGTTVELLTGECNFMPERIKTGLRRFQFHLSTAIVAILLASIFLWANVSKSTAALKGDTLFWETYGFPVPAYEEMYDYENAWASGRFDHSKLCFLESRFFWGGLVSDIVVAVYAILTFMVLAELFLKQNDKMSSV